jgi:hypothetical protein
MLVHPWNADPLPPPQYRLTVEHRRNKDNQVVANSVSRDALLQLAKEFECLDYDFLRLERLTRVIITNGSECAATSEFSGN